MLFLASLMYVVSLRLSCPILVPYRPQGRTCALGWEGCSLGQAKKNQVLPLKLAQEQPIAKRIVKVQPHPDEALVAHPLPMTTPPFSRGSATFLVRSSRPNPADLASSPALAAQIRPCWALGTGYLRPARQRPTSWCPSAPSLAWLPAMPW